MGEGEDGLRDVPEVADVGDKENGWVLLAAEKGVSRERKANEVISCALTMAEHTSE